MDDLSKYLANYILKVDSRTLNYYIKDRIDTPKLLSLQMEIPMSEDIDKHTTAVFLNNINFIELKYFFN